MTENSAEKTPAVTVERITVGLVERAREALAKIMRITGNSKTDSVNRALQLHAYVLEETEKGSQLLIRKPDGTAEIVHLM